MKIKKKLILLSFIFFILIIYQQFSSYVERDTYIINNLKKVLPESTKKFLRKTIFINQTQNLEIQKINEIQNLIIEKIENENEKFKKDLNTLNQRNFFLYKFRFADPMEIYLTKEFEIEIFDEEFEIKKYQTPYSVPKILGKGTAYIGFDQKNIFIVGGAGQISYINKDQLLKNNLKNNFIQPIPTNLSKKITDNRFYKNGIYGIKGTLVFQNKMYISYTHQLEKQCYNTSILVADLNTSFLNFTDFLIDKKCVNWENDYGQMNAAQSGGKIISYDDKNLIVSIGEYRYRNHAQDKSNIFGKIIKIDIDTKEYKILSMGHRNVHGMYYDIKNKKIISVEHGPDGGDEINFNYLGDENIKNFGWPISSYGEHYGGGKNIRQMIFGMKKHLL